MTSKQVPLPIQTRDPYSERFLIRHSGNIAAFTELESHLEMHRQSPETFSCLYLFGPAGSGKTHLAEVFREKARSSVPQVPFELFEVPEGVDADHDDESWAAPIVSTYERMKSGGGILIFLSRVAPGDATSNPHVSSRLLAGRVLELGFPQESEFRAVIDSLIERHNMKLSDYSVDYMLRRLPRKPLSFDSIFARISEFSLAESKPPGLGVIRSVIEETTKGHR